MAAKQMVPFPVGVLLLGAACAVVISTGMNYLLSPSTTVMRDIYQRFLKKDADPKGLVALQKVLVVVIGVVAFLLATQLKSVLEMSFFAYTIYGVAITPALIAALAWKRATRAGGLASIVAGTVVCLTFFVLSKVPGVPAPDGDPWGIPLIYPALVASLVALVAVSLLTAKPKPEELERFFPKRVKEAAEPGCPGPIEP
jgi:SSS family solute:Na+ symporter